MLRGLGDVVSEMVVASEAMRSIMELIDRVAGFDVPVLISGETGTGKELLARIVHQKSSRHDKPFLAINCGTLTGDLFADKLFGHEPGSFTGALRQVRGCFELASAGTLFLDEVSEISLSNQVDFLRVLEDGRYRRIGGERFLITDVRVVAATNRDLALEVKEGRFRRDLYYRIQVIPITVPPLRRRREAIPVLVEHFSSQFAEKYHKHEVSFHPKAIELLANHDWPGNVRQLKNFIERILIVRAGRQITPKDFPPDFEALDPPGEAAVSEPAASCLPKSLEEIRVEAERRAIIEALTRTAGGREKAAQLLKISPRTLRQKMHRYRIRYTREHQAK
ncbi:MAG: sigma-54 dependent transcriptional regulator [Pseudomonadota bacterium]